MSPVSLGKHHLARDHESSLNLFSGELVGRSVSRAVVHDGRWRCKQKHPRCHFRRRHQLKMLRYRPACGLLCLIFVLLFLFNCEKKRFICNMPTYDSIKQIKKKLVSLLLTEMCFKLFFYAFFFFNKT